MLSIVLFALLHQNPPAKPKTVAAPAWSTVQVEKDLAAFYADHTAQVLRQEGLKVITASEISTVLTAQRQLELLGCTGDGTSCMTELANALGADLTLMGSIAKLDETLEVHLKIISSTTGAVLVETSVSAVGQRAMLDELDGASRRLARELGASSRPATRPHSLRFWGLFPGVLGVAAVATGTYFLVDAQSKYSTLSGQLHTPADAETKTTIDAARAGGNAALAGWLALSIGAAAVLVALGMVLFGGDSE